MKSDYDFVTMDPIQRQLWRSPLTTVLAFTLAMGVVGASVYIFVYADTVAEKLENAGLSISALLWTALLLVFAKKREDRKILPRWFRRTLWFGITALYFGAVALFIYPWPHSSTEPIQKLQLSLKIGLGAPIPYLAWRLFRDKNA